MAPIFVIAILGGLITSAIIARVNYGQLVALKMGKLKPTSGPVPPTSPPPQEVAATGEASTYISAWYFYDAVTPGYWETLGASWMTASEESAIRSGQWAFTGSHGADKIGYYWRVLFVWQDSTKTYREVWFPPSIK